MFRTAPGKSLQTRYRTTVSLSGILPKILLGITLGMLCDSGCSNAKPELVSVGVTGKVLIDGQPPARAEIRLKPKVPLQDPVKRSLEPYAIVQADGTFEVGTYLSDDGAPPGEYAVTLVWPTVTIEGGEETFGLDRLGGRFSDPAAPIARVVVEDEPVNIPVILLKSK